MASLPSLQPPASGEERDETVLSLLRLRVREVSKRLLEKNDQVSKDEIDELDRLSKLVAIDEASRSRNTLRWTAVGLSVGLFGIGLYLMLSRVDDTDIILTMSASELAFTTAAATPLTQTRPITSLRATGLTGVGLDNDGGQAQAVIPTNWVSVKSTASSTLSSEALDAPPMARVTVAYVGPEPRQFGIRIEDTTKADQVTSGSAIAAPAIAQANVMGSFVLETKCPTETCPSRRLSYPSTQAIRLIGDDRLVDLTVALRDTSTDLFVSPLRIAAVEPFRVLYADGSRVDSVSTLRTALLVFPDLNNLRREIHPSEIVELKILRDGKLRELSLRSDRLVADFTGTVEDVVIGGRSVMPSRFSWLSAQNAPAVLWSTVASILVAFLAIWRWLQRPT